jgi:hypothetical protein
VNPVILLALALIGFLLGWDWLVKRRRTAQRPDVDNQDFLSAYRGSKETAADSQILDVRRQIARELALPVSKIRPDDDLTDLRDRYCVVVSGHLALGDLFDDLAAARREAGTPTQGFYPETVREYIAATLDLSSTRGD